MIEVIDATGDGRQCLVLFLEACRSAGWGATRTGDSIA